MSNEKTSRPTTSATETSTTQSSLAPQDFKDETLESAEQPKKPPRHKQKVIQPVETTINDLDEESEVSLSRSED
jgi:hypothetical protein